jgi:hypothetical protein
MYATPAPTTIEAVTINVATAVSLGFLPYSFRYFFNLAHLKPSVSRIINRTEKAETMNTVPVLALKKML